MPTRKVPSKEAAVPETDTQNVTPDDQTSETLQELQTLNAPTEQPAVEGQSVAELANHVLHGRFGDFNVVRDNLDKAGADTTAVMTLVNDRLSHGAPAAYRPNVSQVLDSAQRGEWGSKNVGLRVRGAGYSEADAMHVESSLTKDN